MKIVEQIIDELVKPEKIRLTQMLDRVVALNQEAAMTLDQGFLYQGELYRHSRAPAGKMNAKAIDPSLYDEIEGYRDTSKTVWNDVQVIRQILTNLLKDLATMLDVRDALPECVVGLFPDTFQTMPRTRSMAWNLDPESRAYRQFNIYLAKIEYLVAARMIYS